jgi:hypothetical protein
VLSKLFQHVHGNGVAYLALFVALGGSSYAAVRVDSGSVVNNSIRGIDVRNRTLTERDLRRNTLTGRSINESRLGPVPNALNAGTLDGFDSNDFLRGMSKAADSDLLDGRDSGDFLGATGKAADADLLDGKDSTQVGAILTGRIANGSGESTSYAAPSGTTTHTNTIDDATEESHQHLSPAIPTRIGNLSVGGSTAVGTHTLTLRMNGSDTSVACTVQDGQSMCQDTDTVVVPPGSLLSIKRQFNGSSPATLVFGLSVAMN